MGPYNLRTYLHRLNRIEHTPAMTTAPDLSEFSVKEIKEALDEVRHPIDVAVYSLDNYFNFGAIIRVCHNFLVRSVIGVDLPQHYRKADLGTRKYENILKITSEEFFKTYGARNIVAFERRPGVDTKDLCGFVWPENPVMFLGSEKTGVPDEVLAVAHSVVSIPMYGVHNDHNVAIACGIGLYDYTSKRRMTKKTKEIW